MEIKLTQTESETVFFDALCNGLFLMSDYGFELKFDRKAYAKAKEVTSNGAFEDLLMQLLKQGDKLTLEDVEGDGDMTSSITLQDVHERVANTIPYHLLNALSENGDAETADAVLQTVFFKEITFS